MAKMSMLNIGLATILIALLMGVDAFKHQHKNHDHDYSATTRAFEQGREYIFHYDVQTNSGYAPWVSTQQAVGRMQADARIQFIDPKQTILRLENIQDGERQVNGPWDTAEILPMNVFEKSNSSREEKKTMNKLLELPVAFQWSEGIVSNVKFSQNEQPWSKNIKKAILSLIQINLKPINKWEKEGRTQKAENSFTAWETTVEGECETLYVLSEVRNNNSNEKKNQHINVTQSINFDRCNRLADISYGMQIENTQTESQIETQGQRLIEEDKENPNKFGRVVPSNKLQRSSVYRYQLSRASKNSQSEYGIEQVEVVSEYSMRSLNAESKQTEQTIVSSRLIFVESNKYRQQERNEVFNVEEEAENLLYSAEVESLEKSFVMYGDQKYPDVKLLEHREAYENEAFTLIKQMVVNFKGQKQEKLEMNALENVEQFNRLVEVMRYSTIKELQHLNKKCSSENQKSIFLDGLSVAASHNTIKVLVNLIQNDDTIEQLKAAQVLKNLGTGSGLPAPSYSQIDSVLTLCKFATLHNKEILRQSCWLTFGSMLHELVEQSHKNQAMSKVLTPMKKNEEHAVTEMNLYKDVLIEGLKDAKNPYEKIVYLKAIGNAGMPSMLQYLKDLVQNQNESPIIRMHAIEAMHFLVRDVHIGFKVRNALMPVFTNVNEAKHVRLAAIQTILQCGSDIPSQQYKKAQGGSFVDQIIYVLHNEKSEEVIQFVYSMLEKKIESPFKWERNLALHLKNNLKQVHPEQWKNQGILSSAQNLRMPFFSKENNEGLFVDVTSILPNHISLGLDTLLNGEYQRDYLKLSLCQKDMEQLLKQFLEENDSENSDLHRQTGFLSNAAKQLRSIFSNLKIKTRENSRQPFALLSLKMNNIDLMLLPITEKLINGQSGFKIFATSLRQMLEKNNLYKLNGIIPLYRRQSNVPMSSGLPLTIRQQTMLTARIHAQINLVNKHAKFNPEVSVTHVQEMNVNHIPLRKSGVASQRAISFNVPIEVQLKQDKKKELSLAFQLPKENVRLISFETLPITFIYTNWPSKRVVKICSNKQFKSQQRYVQMTFGEEVLSLPIEIKGQYHLLRDVTSFKEIVNVLMTSENEFQVVFMPNQMETPKEIVFTASMDLFNVNRESSAKTLQSMMQDFYAKFQNKFFTQSDAENVSMQSKISNSKNYFSKFSNLNNYKHLINLKVKTVGGRRPLKADVTITGFCDSLFRACETQLEVQRSIFDKEDLEWNLSGRIHTLYPQHVNSVKELISESFNPQQKFLTQVDFIWGVEQLKENSRESYKFSKAHKAGESSRYHLKINVEGRPNKNMLHRVLETIKLHEAHNRYNKNSKKALETSTMTHIRPFVNEYDIIVNYKINSPFENQLNELFDAFKGRNFWNIRSRQQNINQRSFQQSLKSTSEGMILARFTIDPVNSKYANLSIENSIESVHIQNVELPYEMQPMKLVRQESKINEREIESGKQWISEIASNIYSQKTAECTIDGKRVKTFDGVSYSAPTSKCYTVLAKDCSNINASKFAVLMKTKESEKKIKIITSSNLIECESQNKKQVEVRVNGNIVYSQSQSTTDLSKFNISIELDQDHEWMVVENEFGIVRFNGKIIRIQIIEEYMDLLCGLCGNYNEKIDDEWQKNDKEMANDIKSFHKSYTIQEDSECSFNEHKQFYERFEDNENKSFKDREDKENQMKPVEQTIITEYNHKICFSMKAVRQCPKGWRAAENDQEEQLLPIEKVMFTCLERNSIEAKRIKKVLRRNGTFEELAEYSISFVEPIRIPERCIQY